MIEKTENNKNNEDLVKISLAGPSNFRSTLFESLFKEFDSPDIQIIKRKDDEPSETADYNIFFNFDGYEDAKTRLVEDLIDLGDICNTVLDITEDFIMGLPSEENEDESILIVAVSCASHIICDTEKAQEEIFIRSGRLASIVHNPKDRFDLLSPNYGYGDPEKTIWFGDLKDTLAIKKEFRENKNFYLACPVPINWGEESKKRTIFIKTDKAKEETLRNCFAVYLPKTGIFESEIARFKKAEEATKYGKLVIAPELSPVFEFYDFLKMKGLRTLEEAQTFLYNYPEVGKEIVEDQQEKLKEKFSRALAKDKLISALCYAPYDDSSILTNADLSYEL